MFRNAIRLGAATVFAFLLAACGEQSPYASTSGGGNPIPTPTPVGLQTPAAGSIYLGAYVAPENGTIKTLESIMGRPVALDMHYLSWGALFPHFDEPADLANGRYPVDSWDCGMSDAQIASGAADMLIQTRAQAIKAFGHTIFLRWFWDMNLPSSTEFAYSGQTRSACYDKATDNPDGTFSAHEFIAAWIHVRQIFAQENVTNVVWVWDFAAAGSNPAAYYPGSQWVDWVGVDAFDSSGVSFPAMFGPLYPTLTQFNKPILIGETGTTGANQVSYLGGVSSALQSNFAMVKGFMYFDGTSYGSNWTLNPGPGSTEFARLSQTPYMKAMGSP